jgi:hypothetical protein
MLPTVNVLLRHCLAAADSSIRREIEDAAIGLRTSRDLICKSCFIEPRCVCATPRPFRWTLT